jgi:hypothetical protein
MSRAVEPHLYKHAQRRSRVYSIHPRSAPRPPERFPNSHRLVDYYWVVRNYISRRGPGGSWGTPLAGMGGYRPCAGAAIDVVAGAAPTPETGHTARISRLGNNQKNMREVPTQVWFLLPLACPKAMNPRRGDAPLGGRGC